LNEICSLVLHCIFLNIRARAKQMKRFLEDLNLKIKNKKAKNGDNDGSKSEESDISLHESSTSIIDGDETDCDNFETGAMTIDVIPDNIKDGSLILVKFPKKKSIVYYVGKLMRHYNQTEIKVSYQRKKPGLSFVFPNVEDIHTYTHMDMILPDHKPATVYTFRAFKLFTFSVNLYNFNVQ
ncbi:hypothetical protein HHI36_019807, partial [Cryptolaemus montrouzieri]